MLDLFTNLVGNAPLAAVALYAVSKLWKALGHERDERALDRAAHDKALLRERRDKDRMLQRMLEGLNGDHDDV